MNAPSQSPQGGIAKCFVEVVGFIVSFKKTCAQKQTPFLEVQRQIKQLFSQSAVASRDAQFDPRDYDDARFAVVAWVDETMMNVPWVHRGEWQRSLLQTELYATTNAGEEFFERLNRLSPAQNAIREVYYMVLCLGFMGRYCHPGDEIMLGQLRLSNIAALLGARGTFDHYTREAMFDCAYDLLDKKDRGSLPIKRLTSLFRSHLLILIIPLVLLIALFFIFNFVLNDVRDNILIQMLGK